MKPHLYKRGEWWVCHDREADIYGSAPTPQRAYEMMADTRLQNALDKLACAEESLRGGMLQRVMGFVRKGNERRH